MTDRVEGIKPMYCAHTLPFRERYGCADFKTLKAEVERLTRIADEEHAEAERLRKLYCDDSRWGQLNRERKEALAEVERLRNVKPTWTEWARTVDELNEKNRLLCEVLRQRGRHDPRCSLRTQTPNERPCDCGLDSALEGE